MKHLALLLLLLLLLAAAVAHAAPCHDSLVDPIATPLRETDRQRGACLRDELSAELTTHALIDEPNFHGVLGLDTALAGRLVLADLVELSARLRVIDYTFVQTAVNKVTATRFGPASLGAALAIDPSLTAYAVVEVPYSRDEMDTLHTSGQLGVAFATSLSQAFRLHARLATLFAHASSDGGSTSQLALRAGTDLVWQPRRRFALHAGADIEAGWRDGLSTVLARLAGAIRIGASHRLVIGAGIPLGGDEPTNAIVLIGVARDL